MKRWWRFLIVVFLGIILSFRFNQSLQAEIVPSQLVQQAQTFYQVGEFTKSIKLLEQAYRIYQDRQQYLQQAQILSLTSLASQQLGDWELANKNISKSLTLIENIPSSTSKTQVLAQIWHTKGQLEFATGNNDAALEDWHQATALYLQIEDRFGVGGSLLNEAEALEKMGFYRRSCDRILVALERPNIDCENLNAEQIETIITQVATEVLPWQIEGLNQLGNSLLLNGKLSQAERVVVASYKINGKVANSSPLTQAKILLNLGNINKAIAFRAKEMEDRASFVARGNQAVTYYQQLINYQTYPQIARQYRLPAQLNLLSLLVVTEQWSKAQNIVTEIQFNGDGLESKPNLYGKVKFALDLSRLKQKEVAIAYTWQDIADIYLDVIEEGDLIGDLRVESYALGYLGVLEAEGKNINLKDSNPQQLIESALQLAHQINAPEIMYRWQWELGKVYAQENKLDLAIASYQASLATLASLRQDLAALTREIQFDFHEQIEPIYKEYADLLLKEEPVSKENLALAIDAIESLQVAELDNYFQDACTVYDEIDLDSIDRNTAAIYTLILPNRLELIMATKNADSSHAITNFYHHTKSIPLPDLEEIVQQLRTYITEPDRTLETRKLSAQLYDLLIKPFEVDLARNQPQNLVFILDSILQTVPMSALYDGKQYLLKNYAIATTPGLRMINLQPPTEKPSFLAGGVTQALKIEDLNFSALDNIQAELNLFPEKTSEILLNKQFNPDILSEKLNNTAASHIHIATHGQFNSNPNQTFLLMWQKLLTIKDFGNLLQRRNKTVGSPIDLLVLSACDTATGDRFGALGLAGVAVRSGAVTTIATLWQVNDESTAILMESFYQYLQEGHSKIKALQLAQLDLWKVSDKDWVVPAFWSPYIAIGNWQ